MLALGYKRICATLQKLGPYVLIELVLPGGTLIAFLLWLYQRQQSRMQTFPA